MREPDHDDPDERMQAAEPSPVLEAPVLARKPAKGPYHASIALELIDDLELSIGQGLALVGARESDSPEAIVTAIARYLDCVLGGDSRLSRDPSDALLALGCLYGQALCRELGWGWAHLRRTRSPGIVVMSPDARWVTGPRAVIDDALRRRDSRVLLTHHERLRDRTTLPDSGPGRYLRIR